MKKEYSALRKITLILAVAVTILISCVTVSAATVYTRVGSNVRKGPGISYSIVNTLDSGKAVEALRKSGNWTYIQYKVSGKWKGGYIYSGNLSTSGGATEGISRTAATAVWLRKGPGKSYGKYRAVPAGGTVTVYSEVGSWYYVSYKGQYGYIKAGYFVDETSLRVTSTAIYLRKKASVSSKAIAVIPGNKTVKVLKYTGNWVKVTYNGKTGYIHAGYFKSCSTISNRYRIVKTSIFIRSTMAALKNRSNVIGVVPKGGEVIILSKPNSKWYRISYKGKTGYIRAGYFR